MQIPTNFSAAQAVSIASVVSNRDKSSAQTTSAPESSSIQAHLEKSESSNPDRDAQGQGDGLGQHARKQHDQNEVALSEDMASAQSNSKEPNDAPPELDLLC